MRLLSRSQASAEVARSKKAQIDEGMKIANRVDALRATLADLESQHLKYISETRDEAKRMMTGLADGIKALKKEIVGLEAERNRLREPLDAEWQQLETKKEEVIQMVEKSRGMKDSISLEKVKQELLTKKTRESLERARVRERALKVALVEASEDRATANNILIQQQNEKKNQDQKFEARKQDLSQKEFHLKQISESLELQRERQDEKDLELVEREKAVNDKYQTLLRAIERNKQ